MLKNLYGFKQAFNKEGIFFCFVGPISQDLLTEIGDVLEQKMAMEKASKSAILKVFYLVVEKAQNIIHYSAEKVTVENSNGGQKEMSVGIILVGIEDSQYYVITGNMIKNPEVAVLSEKLNRVKGMSKSDLKKYYLTQRRKGPDNANSRGAGLGFIDIAKKASKPIEFHFEKIDDQFSFFSIKTVIQDNK